MYADYVCITFWNMIISSVYYLINKTYFSKIKIRWINDECLNYTITHYIYVFGFSGVAKYLTLVFHMFFIQNSNTWKTYKINEELIRYRDILKVLARKSL